MKKLILFILCCFPLLCLAQNPFTPQFKRKFPFDSLLYYSVPGITGNNALPDTAWLNHHNITYFNRQHTGDGSLLSPIGIKDDTLTEFNHIVLLNDSGNFTYSPYLYWQKSLATFQVTAPINFASTADFLYIMNIRRSSHNFSFTNDNSTGLTIQHNSNAVVTKFWNSGNLGINVGTSQVDVGYGLYIPNAGSSGYAQIGGLTILPNYTTATNGVASAIATKTANYTVTNTNGSEVYFGDAGFFGSPFTFTLPSASIVYIGTRYTFKKIDNTANAITIATVSSQTIDGSTTYVLSSQNNFVSIISDGSNWKITATNSSSTSGFVTAVSIASANGISGSSSGGSTPALTLALGAITPTSTNGVSAATMAFNDATSSIQTQLNGKQAGGTYLTPTSTNVVTNKDLTSGTNTFPTFNQNTTGTALNITATSNSTLTTLSALSLPYSQLTGVPSLSGYEVTSNKTATASTSTTTYPNWLGVENYVASQIPATSTLQAVATAGNIYSGQIQSQNYLVTGTSNAGYYEMISQSASPASVTNHLRLYSDSVNRFSWKNSLYRRTIQVPYPSDYTIRMPYLVTGTTLEDSSHSATIFATITNLALKAPIASPTFTGTVTIPTPFTLGATSVTSTGTQLNYLNAATGTTGATNTNLVYSTSPTLVTPVLGTPASVTLTNGTGLPTTGLTGVIQAAQFPALTGDITTSAGALATALKNTGTAGTYGQVTTDAQGRVTSGTANANLTAGRGITLSNYNGSVTQAVILDTTQNYTWGKVQTISANGIGTTPTDRLILNNTTAAAVGAQQESGAANFEGFGWGTTAGTSQAVNGRMYMLPIQGATASGALQLDFSLNGGAYANKFQFFSSGTLTIGGAFNSGLITNNTSSLATTSADGIVTANTTAATAGATLQYSPRVRWHGTVWNTTATAATNNADWAMEVRPVSGTTPTSTMFWMKSLVASGSPSFSDVMSLTDAGNLTTTGITGNQFTAAYDGSHSFTVGVSSVGLTTLTANGGSFSIPSNAAFGGSITFGSTNSNLYNPQAAAAQTTAVAQYQIGGASTTFLRNGFYGNSNTSLTTGAAYSAVIVAGAPITTFTSGAHPLISSITFKPTPITITGTATVTNAYTITSYPETGGTNNGNAWFNGGMTRVSSLQLDTLTASKVMFTDANKRATSTGIGTSAQLIAGDGSLITTTTLAGSPNGTINILASTQTTLVAGTKALSVTGVTTGSHAYINAVSQGGTVSTTFEYAVVCTSGTVTITALTTGNVTNTLDTSTVNVFVTN